MELGTFGAIISFALDLELQVAEYYGNHIEVVFSRIDSKLLENSPKRVNRLKRIRQELITEMILEPITGVDSDDYSISILEETIEAGVLHQAIRLNDNMRRFYSTMAPLIPMREVQRAFLRLAKENETLNTIFKNHLVET